MSQRKSRNELNRSSGSSGDYQYDNVVDVSDTAGEFEHNDRHYCDRCARGDHVLSPEYYHYDRRHGRQADSGLRRQGPHSGVGRYDQQVRRSFRQHSPSRRHSAMSTDRFVEQVKLYEFCLLQILIRWKCTHISASNRYAIKPYNCSLDLDLDSSRNQLDTLGHTPTPSVSVKELPPLLPPRWTPSFVGLCWPRPSSSLLVDLVLSCILVPASTVLAVVSVCGPYGRHVKASEVVFLSVCCP